MEFRWTALIALWTLLSGPIFGGHSVAPAKVKERPAISTELPPVPVNKATDAKKQVAR